MLFVLYIFFFSASSVIFYDTGLYNIPHDGSFDFRNNLETTRTISFSGTFQTAPQVFIYQEYFDTQKQLLEYQFSITSITFNNFQIFFKCTQVGQVYSIKYNWIALDDQRIQVINSFNLNPPQDKVFIHQLLNVDSVIIGITSLGYSGQIDFKLSITSLTQDSVTVGITKVQGKFSNLIQIGYQILLVASRDIVDLGVFSFTPTYTSQPINLESNKWFIQPIQGINYLYGNQLTLRKSTTIGAQQ